MSESGAPGGPGRAVGQACQRGGAGRAPANATESGGRARQGNKRAHGAQVGTRMESGNGAGHYAGVHAEAIMTGRAETAQSAAAAAGRAGGGASLAGHQPTRRGRSV